MGLLSAAARRALARMERQYESALLRPGASRAREQTLRAFEQNGMENGLWSEGERLGPMITGEVGTINLGAPPRDMMRPISHHTHTTAEVAPAHDSFSYADLEAFLNRPDEEAMFAHATGGGGAYAARGARANHSKASDALQRGYWAAAESLAKDQPEKLAGYNATIPVSRAMRRHGLLSAYGYKPSTQEQRGLLGAIWNDMTAAERRAFVAMHGQIYGLPYPLTLARIGGGASLAGALASEVGNQ